MELIKNLDDYRKLSNELIKAMDEVERLFKLVKEFEFELSDIEKIKTDSD